MRNNFNKSEVSSIYVNDSGDVYAMIWNVSDEEEVITFKGPDGFKVTHTVEPKNFTVYKVK